MDERVVQREQDALRGLSYVSLLQRDDDWKRGNPRPPTPEQLEAMERERKRRDPSLTEPARSLSATLADASVGLIVGAILGGIGGGIGGGILTRGPDAALGAFFGVFIGAFYGGAIGSISSAIGSAIIDRYRGVVFGCLLGGIGGGIIGSIAGIDFVN